MAYSKLRANSHKVTLIPGGFLFGAVLATFLPSLNHDFIGFDDPIYVTGNAHVQQGLNPETFIWAFSNTDAANWHPVTWLSHLLDYQLFGLAPWGHHLTSVFLHAVNTVLLFVLLQQMTGATWRSFIVALLFGLHPLRVESVAWVSERKDVLSSLFFFLTLLAYRAYAIKREHGPPLNSNTDEPAGEHQRPNTKHQRQVLGGLFYLLALMCFMLGLLSKPMLVTLPGILLLMDFWPLDRWRERSIVRSLLVEKIPFVVLALVTCVVTFAVQKSGGAMSMSIPLTARLGNIPVAYCRYLGKVFCPVALAPFYPFDLHWPALLIMSAAVLLLLVTWLILALRLAHPYLAMGWLWFLGILIPVSGLIQVGEQSMADRYTYLASIGILIMLVWGAEELSRPFPLRRFGAAAFVGAVTLSCVFLTRTQLGFWKNSETLFRHTLRVTRENYLAHNNLGAALDRQGRFEEACQELEQALAERPRYYRAQDNLGVVFAHEGRADKAVNQFLQALAANPKDPEVHNHLGSVLAAQGHFDDARRQFELATEFKPDYADAHFNLGTEYQRQQHWAEAAREFQLTLKYQPHSADAHNNLGFIAERLGQLDQAIAHYGEAVQLQPEYARAHYNLGVALAQKGLFDAAIEQFNEAIKLKPDYPAARTNLATLLELNKSPK